MDPRDAAEQPQVDLVDLHAATARDDRVPELVQDDAREEPERADEAEDVARGGRQARILGREVVVSERVGSERDDEHPHRLDADRDARQPADVKRPGVR